MKPFTLDTVLDFRKQSEDIAKNALIKAQQAEAVVIKQLREKEAESSSLISSLDAMMQQGMAVEDHILFEQRIAYVANQLTEIRSALDERKQLVERRKQILIAKSKERKIMEKLKEKKNAAYQKYLDKKEAAVLDEIAVLRYHPEK